MNIICAIAGADAKSMAPDVLVLPEGTSLAALREASAGFPGTIVVGASPEGQQVRAHLRVGSANMVRYLKMLSDGRSVGVNKWPARLPVYETTGLALGVVVCRDIDDASFLNEVLEKLRRSPQRVKLLCIPADMQDYWFPSEPILGFRGVYVALSNNNMTYPEGRAPSFIAAPDGRRIVKQSCYEPILAAA